MKRTNRVAQRILFAVVVFVVTVALLGSIFGAEITWRALVLAAAITFFVGSCQLVIERDRARRAELDKFRFRAVAGEPLAKDQAVKLGRDGKVYIAGSIRGQYPDPVHREKRETPPV